MNIFEGIQEDKLNSLFDCLRAVKKTYEKNEIIFDMGDKITSVYYVLEGKVQLLKDDYDGNKIIINTLSKGDTFAESLVFASAEESPLCAMALEETKILFMDFRRIMSVCSNTCEFHQKLIKNIINIIASKNLFLQNRIELLSKKTIRERILYFLYKEKQKNDNDFFEIPYSREQMAEFIGADRSALSRELAKMKSEMIIDYHKNMFKFLRSNAK